MIIFSASWHLIAPLLIRFVFGDYLRLMSGMWSMML